MDKLHASSFTSLIGEDNIFLTVADAVSSRAPKLVEEQPWRKETQNNNKPVFWEKWAKATHVLYIIHHLTHMVEGLNNAAGGKWSG